MAGLEIDRVFKRFGNVEVIHGVSIGIEDGEFVVLVGPSGCGKSTLLRMIAGLENIFGGRSWIGGQRRQQRRRRKERDIAMVFQNYALYPHMTVARNMGFALELAATPAKAEIAHEGRQGGRDPRARAAISTAFRASSRAASASASRWAARSCATRRCSCSTSRCPISTPSCACRCAPRSRRCISGSQTTTVYVTHDQIEAMTMADRIVVMRDGGSNRSARRSSSTTGRPTVSSPSFIGSPAMNFIPGALEPGEARRA